MFLSQLLHRWPLAVFLLAAMGTGPVVQAQTVNGTVESQVLLLKKKVTIEKQFGPMTLDDMLEKLSNAYQITFVINRKSFEKAGVKDIDAAKVTIVAQKDTELSRVLERALNPVKIKCLPDKGFLSIVPK